MDIFTVYHAARGFRESRMRRFIETFRPTPETQILDVGGFPEFWENAPFRAQITILRPEAYDPPPCYQGKYQFVRGDGTALEYADKTFDIVFSNSVIEHVGGEEKQAAFAREASRVGRSYWVQTPAWEFPIEPHCLTPFVHWLPDALRLFIVPRFTVWKMVAKCQTQEVIDDLREVRMITQPGMRKLFPDGEIIVERVLGWPKSYVAYRIKPVSSQSPWP